MSMAARQTDANGAAASSPAGWWGGALFIARTDARYMLRQRETLLWTFLMPIVFMYFIGTITAGFGGPGDAEPTSLTVVAPPEAGFLADTLAARLVAQGFAVTRHGAALATAADSTSTGVDERAPDRSLAIPAGFTDSLQAGHRARVVFAQRAAGIMSSYERIRVARAVYGLLADMIVVGAGGGALVPAALDSVAALPRTLTLEVAPAGALRDVPAGFQQAVPGILTMFTLLVLLSSGAVVLVIERQQGLLRRLASTPLSPSAIVAGKLGARMALGAIQIGFAMLVGTILFGTRWGPHLGALLLLLAVYATLCAALGLLLGNVARNAGQAIGIAVLASNILAALGGCWWPIEITPRWMQRLALLLPTGWTMDGLHRLVSFGYGPSTIIPHLLVLAVATLALIAVVARSFRFT